MYRRKSSYSSRRTTRSNRRSKRAISRRSRHRSKSKSKRSRRMTNKNTRRSKKQRGGNNTQQYDATMIGREQSLYDRLGGIYAIAAVIDHFSDKIIENAMVGKLSKNEALREWSLNKPERLPGLKWMRTLWVAEITGGPYKYIPTKPGKCPMSLENAHKNLQISPEEFNEVANELARSLDHFKVPPKEKSEVLAAFAAHKDEVNAGYFTKHGKANPDIRCPMSLK